MSERLTEIFARLGAVSGALKIQTFSVPFSSLGLFSVDYLTLKIESSAVELDLFDGCKCNPKFSERVLFEIS